MPEGVSSVDQIYIMREIVDECIFKGFRLIPRLHTLIWNNERSV